jgi:hypothetical protein
VLASKPVSEPSGETTFGTRPDTRTGSFGSRTEPQSSGFGLKRDAARQTSGARIVLTCCPLGSLVFGIESRFVVAIEDQLLTQPQGGLDPTLPAMDLARRYRIELGAQTERRRSLKLEVAGRSLRALVGPEVSVREFSARIRPLPAFVSGLRSLAALQGVIEVPRGYVFLIDVARLFGDAPDGVVRE